MRCAAEFFLVFSFNHTAYKLYSLWHVGYLLDDFYAYIYALDSTFDLYNPARYPDSTKPPQLLGLVPSYFPCIVLLVMAPQAAGLEATMFVATSCQDSKSDMLRDLQSALLLYCSTTLYTL